MGLVADGPHLMDLVGEGNAELTRAQLLFAAGDVEDTAALQG